ncbi:MAG: MBL fold metallo-hydrolase [Myxococcota bacterium]|nr:MBL fold metallo-hydrolase [Myxococcota bacterium]
MRITSGGHAFWYIESDAGRILLDPVFTDPFEQGTVTACPSRSMDIDKIPEHDLLYLSHRHLDHFHIPTLKKLSKDKPVMAPDDKLTLLSLKELGFQDIRPMRPFEEQILHQNDTSLRLIPTPSVSETFVEYGLLVIEEKEGKKTRTLLNQVDTPLSESTIREIKARSPEIDVHLAMFASQDFGWFHAQASQIAETYTQNLHAAMQIGAKLVVPASAGFRFVDRYDYLNAILFPIPRERFMTDIQSLCPDATSVPINPGDVIELEDTLEIKRQSAAFIKMLAEDSHRINHDPTVSVPELVDHNLSGYPLAHLSGFASAVIEQGLVAYLQTSIHNGEKDVLDYCNHHAVFRIHVIFPDGTKVWNFIFQPDGFQLAKGDYPKPPDFIYKITSSALLDLCEGKKSVWAVRPETRRWSRLLSPQNTVLGLRTLEIELQNLLTHFILGMQIRMHGESKAMLKYYGLC